MILKNTFIQQGKHYISIDKDDCLTTSLDTQNKVTVFFNSLEESETNYYGVELRVREHIKKEIQNVL